MKKQEIKVGKKIRVIKRLYGHGFPIGHIGTITEVRSHNVKIDDKWVLIDKEFELVKRGRPRKEASKRVKKEPQGCIDGPNCPMCLAKSPKPKKEVSSMKVEVTTSKTIKVIEGNYELVMKFENGEFSERQNDVLYADNSRKGWDFMARAILRALKEV